MVAHFSMGSPCTADHRGRARGWTSWPGSWPGSWPPSYSGSYSGSCPGGLCSCLGSFSDCWVPSCSGSWPGSQRLALVARPAGTGRIGRPRLRRVLTRRSLRFGLVAGLVIGLAVVLTIWNCQLASNGGPGGLPIWFVFGLLYGLIFGFRGWPCGRARGRPCQRLRRSR